MISSATLPRPRNKISPKLSLKTAMQKKAHNEPTIGAKPSINNKYKI